MIVLLPVSRYRVRYQVASGRPYSIFERFILEAIHEGDSSLESLEQTLRVHRRALIEGVVTLIQAGWVAIERDSHKLLATRSGTRAIRQPDDLPRNIAVLEQTDFVIGERVEGQVARGAEVTFSPRSELREHMQNAVVLPAGDIPHPLEPGVLVPLLRVGELEWIRSCGPIDIVRDGADFAVVDVDTSSEMITGIPSKWVPLLRDELIASARLKEQQLIEEGIEYSSDSALLKLVRRDIAETEPGHFGDPDEWVLDSATNRLVVGNQHNGLLKEWIETAHSYLAIMSESLDPSTVEGLAESFRGAIKRGVVIDVMWGRDGWRNGIHKKALDILQEIERESDHHPGKGRLTSAKSATRSNARILFGDVSETFESVVGSCDWLSYHGAQNTSDLSLVFREREPVARIARLLADLEASDHRLSTGVGLTRLRRAATDLDRQTVEARGQSMDVNVTPTADAKTVRQSNDQPTGLLRVRIVIGRQHHAILPLLASEAAKRLVVLSPEWGPYSEGAVRALVKALERGCQRVEARYCNDSDPGPDHQELQSQVEKLGGIIQQDTDLNARIAVADDETAVVTSFNWLAPTLDRQAAIASDVGFILRGKGVGSTILDRLGLGAFDSPPPLDAQYLTSFRIDRLRSINHIEWRLATHMGPGWHVIVGDNATGKTSILRALAVALIGGENARSLRRDWAGWIRGDENTADVEVSLEEISGSAPLDPPVGRSVRLVWERAVAGTSLKVLPPDSESVLSAGYGPFRRFTGGDTEYEKQLAVNPSFARHISLFEERVALTETLSWLRDLRFKALENDQESTLLLDRVTKLINESGLFPSGVKLTQINSESVIFRDDNGYEYGIDELSDGYRSILSLALDVVRQLAIGFGAARVFDHNEQHVIAAPAIVLIDEIDAHLHPAWQRTVGQWFRLHFPRVQFIVSTHSPLICQAAEHGSVFKLPDLTDEFDLGGMLDGPALSRLVYGNVLEAYASGAFGEEVSRSETSKALLRRLADLNQKEVNSELSDEEQSEQERLRATLPLAAHVVNAGDNMS